MSASDALRVALLALPAIACALARAQAPVVTDADIERARRSQPVVTDADIERARARHGDDTRKSRPRACKSQGKASQRFHCSRHMIERMAKVKGEGCETVLRRRLGARNTQAI